MPRVVQAGGFSGHMRRRYTLQHSQGILAQALRMKGNEGITLRSAALRLGVSHSLLSRWGRRPAIPLHLAGLKKKSVCEGPLAQLLCRRGDDDCRRRSTGGTGRTILGRGEDGWNDDGRHRNERPPTTTTNDDN